MGNGSLTYRNGESVTGGCVQRLMGSLLPGDEVEDFELILSKASDGSYNYEFGEASGKVSVAKGVITFDSEITFLPLPVISVRLLLQAKILRYLPWRLVRHWLLVFPNQKMRMAW